jgi:hypothetical protein
MFEDPLKINGTPSTVNDILKIIGKGLFKDVSKCNNALKENRVTTVKDLREGTPDSWAKWNLPTKLSDELRLKTHSETDFLVDQSLRDSVYYVVDLSYLRKCGSFNPYGNEQMESGEPKTNVHVDVKPATPVENLLNTPNSTKTLVARKIDRNPSKENWKELFDWVKEVRTQKDLSISQFLLAYDIPLTSTNIQFLSGDGTRRPSAKVGTVGNKLRNHLKEAKCNDYPNETKPLSIQERISEDFLVNEIRLLELGIFQIEFNNEKYQVEVFIDENSCIDEDAVRKEFHYLPKDSCFVFRTFRDISFVSCNKLVI